MMRRGFRWDIGGYQAVARRWVQRRGRRGGRGSFIRGETAGAGGGGHLKNEPAARESLTNNESFQGRARSRASVGLATIISLPSRACARCLIIRCAAGADWLDASEGSVGVLVGVQW